MENQNNTNTNQLQTQPVGFMQKLKHVFFGKGSAIPGNPFDGMGPIDISLLIFKNLFKGLKALFIKKVIITVVILGVGWFFTNLLVEDYSRKGIPFLLNLFCFFTYAKAGIYGNLTSILGGVLGKSIIGGLIISILMGTTDKKLVFQLKPDFEGRKLSNICSFVTGIGIAFVLFNFMTVNLDKYNSIIGLVLFFLCMKIQADPKSILLAGLNSFAKNRPVNPKAARMLLLGISWGSLIAFASCWFISKQAEIFYDIGYIVAGIGAIAYIISLFKTPMVPVAAALSLFVLCVIPMANCDYQSQMNKALRDIEKEIPRLEAQIKQAEASVRNAKTPQEKVQKEEELNALRESLKATKQSASQLKTVNNMMKYGSRPPMENICGSSFGGAAGAAAGAAGAAGAASAAAGAAAAGAAAAGASAAGAATGAGAASGAAGAGTASAGTGAGASSLPTGTTGETASGNTADLPKKKKEDEEESENQENHTSNNRRPITQKDINLVNKQVINVVRQDIAFKQSARMDEFYKEYGRDIDSFIEKTGNFLDWSAGDDAGLIGNAISLEDSGLKKIASIGLTNIIKNAGEGKYPLLANELIKKLNINPNKDIYTQLLTNENRGWKTIQTIIVENMKIGQQGSLTFSNFTKSMFQNTAKIDKYVDKIGSPVSNVLGKLGIAGDAYANVKAGDNVVYATAKSYTTNTLVGKITETRPELVLFDAANQFCFGGTTASGICSPTGNIKNAANLAIDSASMVFTGNTDEVAKKIQDGVYGENIKNFADGASIAIEAVNDPKKFGDEFYDYVGTDKFYSDTRKSIDKVFSDDEGFTTGVIAGMAKDTCKMGVAYMEIAGKISSKAYDNSAVVRAISDTAYQATSVATDVAATVGKGVVDATNATGKFLGKTAYMTASLFGWG